MEAVRFIQANEGWSNVGGCSLKNPFNEEKRAECEKTYLEKKASKAKNLSAQAELELAKAAGSKATQPDSGWTAGQTALIIGASLVGLTIMIVVIKRFANKNKAKTE